MVARRLFTQHSADDRRPRVEGVYHVTIELPPPPPLVPTAGGAAARQPVLSGALASAGRGRKTF